MHRRTWLLGSLITLALVIGVAGSLLYAAPAPAADQSLTVSMSGATLTSGTEIEYSIVVANGSSSTVSNVYVAGSIPTGAKFGSATATPAGATSLGGDSTTASWSSPSIAAGAKQTFSYKVSVTAAPPGPAHAFIRWLSPAEGTALSGDVTFQAAINASAVTNRGCQACHVLIDPQRGFATLAFEAEERVKVDFPGLEHPTVTPSGISIKPTDQTGPGPCLECHAPGKGDRAGKGNIAPIALRDIVHPAHLNSPFFKEHYNGSCFTCHNVRGDGSFELLGEKVITNEKGVPRTLLEGTGRIPGAIAPSEGKQ